MFLLYTTKISSAVKADTNCAGRIITTVIKQRREMVILGKEDESIGVKKIGKKNNDQKFFFSAIAWKFMYLSANADQRVSTEDITGHPRLSSLNDK